MRNKEEVKLMNNWDKEFPQYAENEYGESISVERCITCLKPETRLCNSCEEAKE